MNAGFYEEGDKCPECKKGVLDWPHPENCSCHINPPCSACTNNVLACKSCGWEDDPPEYKELLIVPGLTELAYKPKPLDKTKVSFRIKPHTHFSMIKYGIYPEGMTKKEVEEKVKGTFGGRFTMFGNGKFEYIAYTD